MWPLFNLPAYVKKMVFTFSSANRKHHLSLSLPLSLSPSLSLSLPLSLSFLFHYALLLSVEDKWTNVQHTADTSKSMKQVEEHTRRLLEIQIAPSSHIFNTSLILFNFPCLCLCYYLPKFCRCLNCIYWLCLSILFFFLLQRTCLRFLRARGFDVNAAHK